MTERKISAAAARAEAELLAEALATRVPVTPPTERLAGLDLVDAYAIQRELIAIRLGRGGRVIGRKVGLTSRAMQELLGVDQPDYGVVLDSMMVEAGAPIAAVDLIAPRVEAEIAFHLTAPLSGADVSVDDVMAATGQVSAALEIIDSRVADWRITIADTIADNASSGLVLLGEPVDVDGVDLMAEEAVVTVGGERVVGNGAAVLGHPAEAVAWLVRTLAAYGEGIPAGEFVIPGAVAAALPFGAGDTINASYSTLGNLEVTVR